VRSCLGTETEAVNLLVLYEFEDDVPCAFVKNRGVSRLTWSSQPPNTLTANIGTKPYETVVLMRRSFFHMLLQNRIDQPNLKV
jgi:hypothetical protein